MSDTIFENWFQTAFASSVAELKKPIILLFDGHGSRSHLTYNTIKIVIDNEIIIICIPPSHALQPLDAGVFKPLKNTWQNVLLTFYCKTRMQAVEKGSFSTLLKKLWDTKLSLHLVNDFKGAGL